MNIKSKLFILLSTLFFLGFTPKPYLKGYQVQISKQQIPALQKIIHKIMVKYKLTKGSLHYIVISRKNKLPVEIILRDGHGQKMTKKGKLIEEELLQMVEGKFGKGCILQIWEKKSGDIFFAIVFPVLIGIPFILFLCLVFCNTDKIIPVTIKTFLSFK